MKWWWKFQDQTYTSLWKTIIIAKYFSTPKLPVSSFWKEITKLDTIGRANVTYSPGFDTQLKFWTDCWDKDGTLASQFPQLFEICLNPHIPLREVIDSQGRVVQFRRQFDMFLGQEWTSILDKISSISFTHSHDKIAWKWGPSGKFTVCSMYKNLN